MTKIEQQYIIGCMTLNKLFVTIFIAIFVGTFFFCCTNKQVSVTETSVEEKAEDDFLVLQSDTETDNATVIEEKESEVVAEVPVEEVLEPAPTKKIPVTPIIRKKEDMPVESPSEPVVIEKKEETKKVEEPKKIEETPVPAPAKEENKDMAEYKRSVAENTTIDFDTFAEDKKQIMKIIEELIVIMKDGDDIKWRNYVEKSSLQYWSDVSHLAAYSKKLPQKTVRMKTLKDYFKWVFVPSRKGQTIDEIRYISNENIKAVQVRDDKDIVYYYFRKENGKWKIFLPTM